MATFKQVVSELQTKRRSKETEIEKLNLAITALTGLGGSNGMTLRKKPHFSAEAKERIAAAQRLRWRKIKAAQKK